MALERDFELLDDYIRNRLTPEEKVVFEQRLKEDNDLQREYDIQHKIVEGIRHARKAELKALLNNIPVKPAKSTKPSTAAKWTGFGIVALLIGAGVFFYFQGEDARPVPQDTSSVDLPSESTAPILPEASTPKPEEPAPQESVDVDRKEEKESGSEKSVVPPSAKPEIPPTRKMDIFDPTAETEQPAENGVTEPASTTAAKRAPTITTEIIDSKKYTFHYQFQGDKLFLYGSFDKNVYEILEFFTDNKRTAFLFYKDNYYLLNDQNEKIKPLSAVTDPALLKRLQEHRSH